MEKTLCFSLLFSVFLKQEHGKTCFFVFCFKQGTPLVTWFFPSENVGFLGHFEVPQLEDGTLDIDAQLLLSKTPLPKAGSVGRWCASVFFLGGWGEGM